MELLLLLLLTVHKCLHILQKSEPEGSINKATKLPFSAFDPAVRLALNPLRATPNGMVKKFNAKKSS